MTVNLLQPQEVSDYLHKVAEGDREIAFWLDIAVGKSLRGRKESAVEIHERPSNAPDWARNKWDVCGPFHRFVPDAALEQQVGHIKDWLVSARINNEDFLKDVDDKNRPKKLLALNLESAHNAADKYFERQNQKLRQTFKNTAAHDDKNTKTVMDFGDGYRIVQLLTPEALRFEGPAMGHCIGGGGYDERLKDGSCQFFSLRDTDNKPHATFHVEVEGNILRQCKGKENKPPVSKYMPHVQKFVTEKQYELREGPSHTGLIKMDGKYHNVLNLPDGLAAEGNLDLSGVTELKKLPDNFSVSGNLDLWGCTDLVRLSNNLSVGGWLTLYYCPALLVLPENLSVGGGLDLRSCPNIKKIPKTIKVEGWIKTDLGTFKTVEEASAAFAAKYPEANPVQLAENAQAPSLRPLRAL